MNGTAFITGASSGIGAVYANRFAAQGYDLVLTGRRKELLENITNELSEKYKVKTEFVIADFSKDNDLLLVENKLGSIENLAVLINNAGFGLEKSFHETNLEKKISMIKVHNLAAVALTHIALPVMIKRKGGIIINVSSVASFVISPKDPIYTASKLFLNNFTEGLHVAYSSKGIKFQAFCPGFTLTDFHKKLGFKDGDPFFKKFYSADFAVDCSLKDLKKNKVISIPGFKYKLLKIVPFIPRKIFYMMIPSTYRE